MHIQEIISVKEIQHIIQLGNESDLSEVMESFVWTDDIKLQLQSFAKKIGEGKGGGVFLKGHYGTGKSHLLSYLAASASNWKCLEAYTDKAKGHFSVALSLIHWQAKDSLESIVSSALLKNPDPTKNRLETFKDNHESLNQQGYQGYIILFDELSEFLKSKKNPAELAEDLRYLQFLSEFGRDHSSWVVGAIQENIEGIGSASRETSLKLKDRFHIRWDLGALHIEQMLAGRLIIQKEGASEQIQNLFLNFQKKWPEAFQNLASFCNIYPLHPGCLDYLLGLGPLFSEHRGALRFVQQILLGDWLPNKEAHLLSDTSSLISADLLFDYFSKRFNENLELREYYNKAYTHLIARIHEILKGDDIIIAEKVVKIILLSSIDPRKEGVKIDEIGALLLFEVAGNSELGNDYIEERIVTPLLNRVNYLVMENGRLVINLKHQSFELLGRILEKRMLEARIEQHQVWERMMKLMDRRPLDLKHIWENPNCLGNINWLNTSRKISLGWGADSEATDIIILLPFDNVDSMQNDILYWQPRPLNAEEEQEILLAYSMMSLLEEKADTIVEEQAKGEASRRKKAELSQWRSICENIYREGKWLLAGKEVQLSSDCYNAASMEGLFEDGIYELLTLRHPLFRTVAPKLSFLNERILTDLIETIVMQGEMSEADLKKCRCLDAVLGVMKPMNLVVKFKNRYRYTWDSGLSPLVLLFDEILTSENGQLQKVKESLNQGDYGLPPSLIHFMIWSSVAGGYYQAKRDGDILPIGKISFQNVETIDSLLKVQSLSEKEFNILLSNPFFKDADHTYSGLSLQRQLWQYVEHRLRNIPQWSQIWEQLDFESLWSFAEPCYRKYRDVLIDFSTTLTHNPISAQDGLLYMCQNEERSILLDQALLWADSFARFHQRNQKDIEQYLLFIQDEFLDELPKSGEWLEMIEDRRNLLAESQSWSSHENPWTSIELWLTQVHEWQNAYCLAYTKAHQLYYSVMISEDEMNFRKSLANDGLTQYVGQDQQSCLRNLNLELSQKPFCRCSYSPSWQASQLPSSDYEPAFARFAQLSQDTTSLSRFKSAILDKDWLQAQALWREAAQAKPKVAPKRVSFKRLMQRWKGKKLTREQLFQDLEQYLGQDNQTFEFEE
ncbi:MAG: hypothetical protein HQL32_01190 [Planctomycetes bacterium]|nr:hypothetical protein [Planctomycetota bacterium]